MSHKVGVQEIPLSVRSDNLRELLLQGNIFQSDKKIHLSNVISQIQNGNKKLYQQFVTAIIEILKQANQNKEIKQIAFDHITELMVTANYWLVRDLNKDLFQKLQEFYDNNDGLANYIVLWKQMYNGKDDREDFPNLSKTLQKIQAPPSSTKLTGKLAMFYNQFSKNIQKLKEKKVEFFEDFDDSSVSESFIDQNRMTEIVYMDIMQLKAIRERVQTQQITEQNCAQYLIKMKTFLNLKSTSITGDLLKEFNKQKIWARHFIDHHQDYLNHKHPNQSLQNKTTNQLNISLSKDEQSMDMPQGNFQKSKKKLQSQINNFTINEMPVDESRFTTQRKSNGNIPAVFNNDNSQVQKYEYERDYVIERSQRMSKGNDGKVSNQNLGNTGFERKKQGMFQQISRPSPEETLLLQESTLLNNISIPIQLANPMKLMMTKNPTNRFNQFPTTTKYNDINSQNIEYSTNKKDLSVTNNPFANSKTNYNPQQQSTIKQYDNKLAIDIHSPIRNRMTQDDLDGDNLGDELVVRPHYYKNLAFSTAQKNQNNNKFIVSQYAKTQLNFYPPQDNFALHLKSQQKMYSQQLSPQSGMYGDRQSNKKRLSQLTSQKKQRKTNALHKQDSLNSPQEYAFRPYSIHFRKDLQGFNNFKRNCLYERFPIYISEELIVSCRLRRVKESRVQVEIVYQKQIREQLSLKILYKIPKSLKIQKVSKIHRKFYLANVQTHKFNLKVAEFPLQMCFLQLSYSLCTQQHDPILSSAHIPLPITIKNFIQTLPSNRQQWIRILKMLTTQNLHQPYIIEKTFQVNRDVAEPASLSNILGREFINVGASEGYSVEEFGCICHYREIGNLMFLLRIAVRVDHIATLSIITENQLTINQKDFLNYFMDILLTIFANYSF